MGLSERLKFRAWVKCDPDADDWSVGMMVDVYSIDLIKGRSSPEQLVYAEDLSAEFELERCILMQCTGLSDTNGVLIYEGDLLEPSDMRRHSKDKFVVEWKDAGFWVDSFLHPLSEWQIEEYRFKVAGNIHECHHQE